MARKLDIEVYTPADVFDALHVRYGNKKNEKVFCPAFPDA